jgi:hypothetical protein|tara:strand:- start:40637 stop:41023 length:387 start_codon:yes stop_codon:yes gene_type:complete
MAEFKQNDDWKKWFHCTDKQIGKHIVDRTEAYEWLNEVGVKVTYLKELKDGTPRRMWKLKDPEGIDCGILYTALGDLGTKNKDNYLKDLFDFMEVKITRAEWDAPQVEGDTMYRKPKTAFYYNKHIAG